MNKSLDSYVLYSGGGMGADRLFGVLAHKYGVGKQFHIRPKDNSKIHKDLVKLGLNPTVMDDDKVSFAIDKIYDLIKVKVEPSQATNLIVRNYFMVCKAESVFAITYLNGNNTLGSGRMAVELGIALELPVYVLDIRTECWYTYDYDTDEFVFFDDIPPLTSKFAGVGSLVIEGNSVKDPNTGLWVNRKDYVGDEKASLINSMVEDVFIKAAFNQPVELDHAS